MPESRGCPHASHLCESSYRPKSGLRSGFFGKARLRLARRPPALTGPVAAAASSRSGPLAVCYTEVARLFGSGIVRMHIPQHQ